jgi:hypothetical protein
MRFMQAEKLHCATERKEQDTRCDQQAEVGVELSDKEQGRDPTQLRQELSAFLPRP